jgi:hypothetical protein
MVYWELKAERSRSGRLYSKDVQSLAYTGPAGERDRERIGTGRIARDRGGLQATGMGEQGSKGAGRRAAGQPYM